MMSDEVGLRATLAAKITEIELEMAALLPAAKGDRDSDEAFRFEVLRGTVRHLKRLAEMAEGCDESEVVAWMDRYRSALVEGQVILTDALGDVLGEVAS